MRFLITEKLGPHKFKTPEGYLICTDAILSRTGKQEYKRCELFGDACEDPDKIVNVDRIDAEVFDDKAMASFENKPICIEHPDEDVNVENHNDLSVGFVRDIHKGEDNGKPVMMGTLVITDKNAVEAVESGEYKELSCGYDCDINDDDEPCQRNIRGNHVALCKQGRAGIARIVDSKTKDSVIKTIDLKGSKHRGDIGFIKLNLINANECWISIEGLYEDDNSGLINIFGRTACVKVKKDDRLTVNIYYTISSNKLNRLNRTDANIETTKTSWKEDVIRYVEQTYSNALHSVKTNDSVNDSLIDDGFKDVSDLTKFKMALRSISKMYSNDPGIEYVTSILRNLGYEVTVDSIDGWRENKNVPGEHIKKYRMNITLDGKEHHFLVELYADMGVWKVKEINAYMLDSNNIKQGEYMKDEDFSKKTKQGYQVLEMYRDGGRLHVIFKRANDFGIGLGYDTTDGQWSQGRYDFSTLEKARQALMEEKPYARRIQDSVNDDNWSSVEEENYKKANKPVGAKDVVEKNFKIYVKNAFGAYKVADWPAVSKEAAVKEFLEMNPAYRNKGIIEARDSVSDSCIYDTGKWYRVAYYTIVGNSTNNYELFVRAEGYSDAKAKAAKAAKRIHRSEKICPTFDMHVSEVSEQEAKRQNPSIVFDSEVNFSDSAQTQDSKVSDAPDLSGLYKNDDGDAIKVTRNGFSYDVRFGEDTIFNKGWSFSRSYDSTHLLKYLKQNRFTKVSKFDYLKDSKERLFTVEYEYDGVTYVHKVRASSIEDAISKVKDDGHKVVVFTKQVLSEMGKNNSIGKYDRVVQAMRSLYSESLLPDDKLKELIRKKVPEYIKKYVKE